MIGEFDDLSSLREKYSNQKIVLTSGTFDLFHIGHLKYLKKVKEHGDIVVVMLSGDARVRARKGLDRPIINEDARAQILDSLKIVDYVFIDPSKVAPEETDSIHAEILKELDPDYYVTDGPDPRFVNIMNTSKFVILERLQPEPSTTSIIKKIQGLPS